MKLRKRISREIAPLASCTSMETTPCQGCSPSCACGGGGGTPPRANARLYESDALFAEPDTTQNYFERLVWERCDAAGMHRAHYFVKTYDADNIVDNVPREDCEGGLRMTASNVTLKRFAELAFEHIETERERLKVRAVVGSLEVWIFIPPCHGLAPSWRPLRATELGLANDVTFTKMLSFRWKARKLSPPRPATPLAPISASTVAPALSPRPVAAGAATATVAAPLTEHMLFRRAFDAATTQRRRAGLTKETALIVAPRADTAHEPEARPPPQLYRHRLEGEAGSRELAALQLVEQLGACARASARDPERPCIHELEIDE